MRVIELGKGGKVVAEVLDAQGKPAVGKLDQKPIVKTFARVAFLYVLGHPF